MTRDLHFYTTMTGGAISPGTARLETHDESPSTRLFAVTELQVSSWTDLMKAGSLATSLPRVSKTGQEADAMATLY